MRTVIVFRSTIIEHLKLFLMNYIERPHGKNGIWIVTVSTWHFTRMTFKFLLEWCVYTAIFTYHLTKNYWNYTVIFTGIHMNYSNMEHEIFTGSFQLSSYSTTSLNLTLNFELLTLNFELLFLDFQLWMIDFKLFTFNFCLLTFNFQIWLLMTWCSTFDFWLLTCDFQFLTSDF